MEVMMLVEVAPQPPTDVVVVVVVLPWTESFGQYQRVLSPTENPRTEQKKCARANLLSRYVEDYASLLKEESRRREESKSIDNVKRGEIEEECKLNAGCNHALSSSDIMCSTNAGAKKKAILTISNANRIIFDIAH